MQMKPRQKLKMIHTLVRRIQQSCFVGCLNLTRSNDAAAEDQHRSEVVEEDGRSKIRVSFCCFATHCGAPSKSLNR